MNEKLFNQSPDMQKLYPRAIETKQLKQALIFPAD